MIELLQNIVDFFVCWIQTGVTLVINAVIAALGLLAQGALAVAPEMPTSPSMPPDVANALAAANYYLPLTFALTLLVLSAGLILAIWVLKIPLRWIKAES